MTLVALAAAGVAAYLAFESLTGGVIAGCDGSATFDCDSVLATAWSRWLGIPVALPGALLYLTIAVVVWFAARDPLGMPMQVLVALVTLAFGAAAWFVSLQTFVIESWCRYCLMVHSGGVLMVLLTAVLIVVARRAQRLPQSLVDSGAAIPAMMDSRSTNLMAWFGSIALGLLGVGMLAVGQWLTATELNAPLEEIALTSNSASTTDNEETPTTEAPDFMDNGPSEPEEETPVTNSAKPSRLKAFTALERPIDLYEYPMLGDPEAPQVLIEMLDYNCKHCRRLHPRLLAARERYGDDLAIVLWFTPLESACNSHLAPGFKGHRDSCEYARLSYSVWHLAPEKFEEYHNWLMEGVAPPTMANARKEAFRLVGDRVSLDNDLKQSVLKQISWQCDQWSKIETHLPIVVFPDSAVRGVGESDEQVFKLFEQKLDVTPQATDVP
ncbi:Vitamin K epoxide reductase family protein [Aeoliella mucimassa]|uniref:Vitamin K epoxide reductase family protein n=2 Tax=Aeoliella mucimassa TaxID=2527972 RepID=A0A518AJS7_9BACT|nr:Vitamin K epoxide reductase family protein [Aeoliella mucimassa]